MIDRTKYLLECVNRQEALVLSALETIGATPETGYREWKTSRYLADKYRGLGYHVVEAGDIPGFYTDLDTGTPGPKILVMAELDALLCPENFSAVNGVSHACGHHAQSAGMLGLAAALKEADVLKGLSGSIRLMAVPAEELIEVAYRKKLREQGVIRFFGGKAEFLSRGYMSDVDMAILIHTRDLGDNIDFFARRGSNGFISKEVFFEGKAAHAASNPEGGVNALYAASLGLNAVNAIRERFNEKEKIRVHGIITDGGGAANVIPDRVRLEMQVRGASSKAIRSAAHQVDQALTGAAISIGAGITITNSPGYTPLENDPLLMEVFRECAEKISGKERVNIDFSNWSSGSTDMGDLCGLMPTIQPYAGGATGQLHADDFAITNPQRACMNSAKAEILLLDKLLREEARRAKTILASYHPKFTQEEYLAYLETCFYSASPIQYIDEKIIRVAF